MVQKVIIRVLSLHLHLYIRILNIPLYVEKFEAQMHGVYGGTRKEGESYSLSCGLWGQLETHNS